jgi:hypothetical protein
MMHEPWSFREAVDSVPLGASVEWTFSYRWLWELDGQPRCAGRVFMAGLDVPAELGA